MNTINEIFSPNVWDELEVRLPKDLTEAKALFNDFASSIKQLFAGAGDLKALVDATNKLTAAEKQLAAANRTLQSTQLAAAKSATEAAKANLLDAKAKTEAAKQSKILSDQSIKEAAAANRLTLANNSLTDAYRKLDAEHKQAVIDAKNAGIEFGIESEAFKRLASAANDMRAKLFAVDQQLGFNQRNVGNYKSGFDGLSNAINQLTREAPAFANSLQTGFMAISNNFAALQDAITQIINKNKEAKQATLEQAEAARQGAVATALANGETQEAADSLGELAAQQVMAAAEGKKGAGVLKQLAGSLFSFTTLVSLAVTLLTIYGPAIIEWIANVSEADKVQDRFNKNLKEANKSIAEEMSTLIKAQSVLTSNTSLRREQAEALANLQATYPGYFDNLTTEALLTEDVNKAIERQIEVLTARAEQAAAAKTLTESTENLIEAQQNLNKEYSVFESFLAEIKNPGVPTAIAVLADKNNDLKDAYEGINAALELSLSPQEKRIKALQEERKYSERIIDIQQKGQLTDEQGIEITNRIIKQHQDRLVSIDREIDALNALRNATDILMVSQKRVLAQGDLELLSQQNRTLSFKEGSRERIDSEKREIEIRLNNQRQALKMEYGLNQQGLDQNREFLERDQNLLRNAINDKNALDEKYNKDQESLNKKSASQSRSAESQAEKDRKARIAAEKELSDAIRDLNDSQLQIEVDRQRKIYENTQGLLENRLIAYGKYFTSVNEQAAREYEKQISDVVSFEQQYNQKIKDALATEESNRSNSQKTLLIRYEAFQKRRLAITAKYEQQMNLNAIQSAEAIAEITTNGFKADTKNAEELGKRYGEILKNRESQEKKFHDDRVERDKKYRDSAIEFGQEIASAFFSFQQARIQAEINALDLQKTKIEENLAIAIAGIKAQGLSEEERTKKIGELEERAAVDSANIDKEKRKRAREQAKFDKAQAIANIILNTAVAVIKAFTEGDPFTKAFRAIAAGTTGAAQLAVASAVPIPSYAEGTKDHPGGLALVHDKKIAGGYESELIQEPGMKPFWTTGNKPQLINMRKGTRVTPFSQVANMAQASAMGSLPKNTGSYGYGNGDVLLSQVNKNLKTLNGTVKNKKETTFKWNERGIFKSTKTGNAFDKYLNDNLQN